RIEVLQTPTLPLGYPAIDGEPESRSAESPCQRGGQAQTNGVMECWSVGGLNHYPTTPILHHSTASRRSMASRSSQLFARALARIPGGVNSPVRAFRGL